MRLFKKTKETQESKTKRWFKLQVADDKKRNKKHDKALEKINKKR